MPKPPRINRKALFFLVGFISIVGAVVLGFFQFRWIRDASDTELGREQKSIALSMENALEDASTELWALLSFAMVPTNEKTNDVDLDAIVDSVNLWRLQTSHPALLRSLMFVAGPGGLAFDLRHDAIQEVPIPASYRSLIESGLNADGGRQLPGSSLLGNGIILVPYPGSSAGQPRSTNPGGPTFLVVEIDVYEYLHNILPQSVEAHLPGYSYRIVRGNVVIFASGDIHSDGRSPDARHALFTPLFTRSAWRAAQALRTSETAAGSGQGDPYSDLTALPNDPVSRYWALRLADRGEASRGGSLGFEPDSLLAMELYAPGTSLESLRSRRMILDLSISFGVLTLFLGALFFLLRFYHRSEQIRVREREFVSTISHELRTPVSVIRSISENLADGVRLAPSRLVEYGSLIREQSERLGRMVESILAVSGMNQGHQDPIDWAKTDVFALVRDVIRVLEPTATNQGVTIRFDQKESSGEFLTDPIALRLIVENLITNGIRHASVGESDVVVSVRVQIVTDLDEPLHTLNTRLLRIVVEDTGPGISSRDQRHLFDAFYRGQNSRANQTPGSGLGLHLVNRAVRLLGGTIDVISPYESALGAVRGSRFGVELPEGGRESRVR